MKKLVSIILCLSMLLTLCACGKKDESSAGSSGRPKLEISGNTVTVDSSEYTLSEYLSNGSTIWYQVFNGITKGSSVDRIFVFEPNGTMYYANSLRISLGDLEAMTDADIISMVKDTYAQDMVLKGSDDDFLTYPDWMVKDIKKLVFSQEYLEEIPIGYLTVSEELKGMIRESANSMSPLLAKAVDANWENIATFYYTYSPFFNPESESGYYFYEAVNIHNSLKAGETSERFNSMMSRLSDSERMTAETMLTEIDTLSEMLYNYAVNSIETEKANVQPAQYKLSIQTDDTGNRTESMRIVYQSNTIQGVKVDWLELEPKYTVAATDGTIYDSIYRGYSVVDCSTGMYGGTFCARVNTDVHFGLDDVSDTALPVDVSVLDMFE